MTGRFKISESERTVRIACLILLLFFSYGLRENYLSFYTTIYDSENVKEYKTREQKTQAELIRKITEGKGRVFFLNQIYTSTDEFGANPALYYLDGQISDTLTTPSQYNESGALVRHSIYSNLKIAGFPQVLSVGKFAYVWLYKTNSYLNQELPKVMAVSVTGETERDNITDQRDEDYEKNIEKDNPANLMDGQLYKVIYDKDGYATGLQLVQNLVAYDNLKRHVSEQ